VDRPAAVAAGAGPLPPAGTGSALPDALTTIVIGLLLGYVAVKLTRRNRQLLSNQGIPERYLNQLHEQIGSAPGVRAVERLEAIYLGPREILARLYLTPVPPSDG
jgi:divalent metal cation (Fe/Co/Zn/Cd) transporter